MKKFKNRVFTQPNYTRFKTLDKLEKAFNKFPQQIPATPQAFEQGLVADFIDPYTKQIVSAHEIKHLYRCSIFEVFLLDGNKVLIKEDKGKFSIKIDKK